MWWFSSEENGGAGQSQQEPEGPEWRAGVLSSLQGGEGQDQETRPENIQVGTETSYQDVNLQPRFVLIQLVDVILTMTIIT